MKKILALTLTSLLLIGGAGMTFTATAATAPAPLAEARETAENVLYLVPGTYVSDGEKVENTISSGANKLSATECAEIFTENAYVCSLSAGATLPKPASTRVDGKGNSYTFNGWWTIVDATVTYFDKVPALTETTFLYADWRADLSQRKDPIEVDDTTVAKPAHYMSVLRAATGETEILALRVSGTNEVNADTLGYDRPVQIYNGWFELNPGDVITVYASGLGNSDEAQLVPFSENGTPQIVLESSGDNITGSYMTASVTDDGGPQLTYRKVLKTRHYRIYIKFYAAGSRMNVYMEPMD